MACEKENANEDLTIEGTYLGTLSLSGSLKSSPISSSQGTAIVSINNDEEIYVHCYGSELDTTFMLNYYEHNDSVLVCLTGEDFQHMYGHSLGEGHMIGHSTSGETSWQHHLSDEHDEDDEHFGGFHMGNHTYNYLIETPMGDYHFTGTKT
jgi:hypothetical protein